MSVRTDMERKRYGRLVGVCYLGDRLWLFACDCGNEKVVDGSNVRSGKVNSCGCIRSETSRLRATIHGQIGTPTYITWSGMIQRCTNTKKDHFERYGGRGIAVCRRWHRFENFLADMGERPDGLTLERRNNNKGYTPSNCVWATRSAQARNKSNNRVLRYMGQNRALCEWAEIAGIHWSTLRHRIDTLGWRMHEAMTVPLRSDRRRPGKSAVRAL